MTTLSPMELNTLTYIQRYMSEHGTSPATKDIAAGIGKSPSAVVKYLDRLEAHGRIAREPGKARSIRIVGTSAAGAPIDADLWRVFAQLVERAHDLSSADPKLKMQALQVYSRALAIYQEKGARQ